MVPLVVAIFRAVRSRPTEAKHATRHASHLLQQSDAPSWERIRNSRHLVNMLGLVISSVVSQRF